MEEGKSALKNLTGTTIGKRPLGRSRRRWEDNIRMYLEEIGINAGNWVDSAQDRDYWRAPVIAALNRRVPQAMELVSYSYYYIYAIFNLINITLLINTNI